MYCNVLNLCLKILKTLELAMQDTEKLDDLPFNCNRLFRYQNFFNWRFMNRSS